MVLALLVLALLVLTLLVLTLLALALLAQALAMLFVQPPDLGRPLHNRCNSMYSRDKKLQNNLQSWTPFYLKDSPNKGTQERFRSTCFAERKILLIDIVHR